MISNHSLEHIVGLPAALTEIVRILQPRGALYVAVPDAVTFTDVVYRWIFKGGGHVNAFRSADRFQGMICQATGLRLSGRRLLHTSLIFLDPGRLAGRAPRKLWLFGNGRPWFVAGLTYVFRQADRVFRTRLSVYGWAFYFGEIHEQIDTIPWTNVCVRCGTGHPAASLTANGEVKPTWCWVKYYRCNACGCPNLFTEDRHNDSM